MDRAGSSGVRPAVVPSLAGRSLWLAAIWTGVGAAFVGAVMAIVAVAICWLPASGPAGNASSAIHAGLLTFLAGLHGGVTVDSTHASFVPLGLTIAVAALAWRAGTALGDAADDAGERDQARLLGLAATQLACFAVACGVTSVFATLGTSSTSPATTALAATMLWLFTGSVGFARCTELGREFMARRPDWLAPALRLGAACVAVYLAAGALIAAASLALHYSTVTTLSRQVGGGWSGLPVLLLGMLTTPNAAVAGAGYLSGAGFAIGTGTVVRLWSATHGAVPAFPLLGALPLHSAGAFVWLLAVATPLTAGCCVALLARRAATGRAPWRDAGLGIAAAAVFAGLAAAVAGGGIGDAGLATIGVSPWEFAIATAGGSGAATAAVLGVAAAAAGLRDRGTELAESPLFAKLAALPLDLRPESPDDTVDPDAVTTRLDDAVPSIDPDAVTTRLDDALPSIDPDAVTTRLDDALSSDEPDPGKLAG